MGTIFKYNNTLYQCQNLQKKLKKMRVSEDIIEIIKDNIPSEDLEKTFVELTRVVKKETEIDDKVWFYIFQNPDGDYLWGVNKPELTYIERFGFNTSDYKLIGKCLWDELYKYDKWNPTTKTGIKNESF